MDLKNIVIVTAIFDIGRDKWDNFTMSYNTYLYWMKNILSLDVNIVIYTEEKFFKDIYNNRKEFDPEMSKTKIILQDIKELTAYKLWYTPINNLMKSQEFKNIIHFDVPEMTKPLYNIIMFNKLYWLKHCKDNNYFNNDFLIWTDAGTYRDKIEEYANKKWPNPKNLNINKPTFFSHHIPISIHDIKSHALSQMRFIHGTCFLIPSFTLSNLINEVEYTINTSLQNHYIGSDEKMFDITYKRNPKNFNLIKSNWREYITLLS